MDNISEWSKTCLNKSRFTSAELADKKIAGIKIESGSVLYRYYCPHCFGWHLTRKPSSNIIIENKLAEATQRITTLEAELEQLRENNKELQKTNKLTDTEKKGFKKDAYNRQLISENDKLKNKLRKVEADYQSVFNQLVKIQIQQK